MPTAALPLTLDEITPAWLTQALAPVYPGVEVHAARQGRNIGGTATKIRLELEYNDAARAYDLPGVAWLKGGFESHVYGHAASYIAEARFFAEWAPLLPINLPRAYYTGIDPEGRQGLVLLEDLDGRGATYGRSTSPLRPEIARKVLDVQARLHARFWADPVLARLRSYKDRFAASDYFLKKITAPEFYAKYIETERGALAPKALLDPQHYARAMRALYEITESGTHCLTQGDAHLGNTFFEPDGTPGLLDWQAYIHCQPMQDIAYFLIGALTIDDRRAHERELLAYYLDRLAAHGVKEPPGFDTIWLSYRRFALHGFAWSVTPTDFHPEEVILAYAQRYGAACADLETMQALGC